MQRESSNIYNLQIIQNRTFVADQKGTPSLASPGTPRTYAQNGCGLPAGTS